jgi:hypothetical protein
MTQKRNGLGRFLKADTPKPKQARGAPKGTGWRSTKRHIEHGLYRPAVCTVSWWLGTDRATFRERLADRDREHRRRVPMPLPPEIGREGVFPR